MKRPEIISATQAASILGVSKRRVHQLIADGTLPARKSPLPGGTVEIARADLDRPEVRDRPSAGRPRKPA